MLPTLLFPGYRPQAIPSDIAAVSHSFFRLHLSPSAATMANSPLPDAHAHRPIRKGARLSKDALLLVQLADEIGRRTQYSCAGFLPNARQVGGGGGGEGRGGREQ